MPKGRFAADAAPWPPSGVGRLCHGCGSLSRHPALEGECASTFGHSAAAPVFAGQRSSRVTEVRPLSVITDGSNQVWKMMEVNWVEEDTLVSATHPVAAQKQDHYRTLIPVAVHFD